MRTSINFICMAVHFCLVFFHVKSLQAGTQTQMDTEDTEQSSSKHEKESKGPRQNKAFVPIRGTTSVAWTCF